MDIRVGYWIEIGAIQPVPVILLLDPHRSRQADFVSEPKPRAVSIADGGEVPVEEHTDGFGNLCRRLVIPAGGAIFTNDMVVRDPGLPDQFDQPAAEVWPPDLPSDEIEYMLPNRHLLGRRAVGRGRGSVREFLAGLNRVKHLQLCERTCTSLFRRGQSAC